MMIFTKGVLLIPVCVKSDKVPLLHELKHACLPVGFLINITYTANDILYTYSKMASLFPVYGL